MNTATYAVQHSGILSRDTPLMGIENPGFEFDALGYYVGKLDLHQLRSKAVYT